MSTCQFAARPDSSFTQTLAEHVSPLLARLYATRGIKSVEQLSLKLSQLIPAGQLTGLQTAVDLLDAAIAQKTRILIVGDFDADGATSTALMVLALTAMDACVDYLVPDRFKYGYGLTPEIVALAIADYQPELIVTVDNGISSHAGVDAAHAAGVQVIITDHHLTSKKVPACAAVVNPNQPDCRFPSKALAGVGVAFYVLAALATQRKKLGKSSVNLTQYLDLVALGTVADVAQLDYNNRILVAAGVERIRQAQCRPGILALLDIAGRQAAKITPQDLGFVLGPRINAAGRMENMRIGIDCLLAHSFADAMPLAQQLDELNRERRSVEAQMKQQALDLLAQSEQTFLQPSLSNDVLSNDVLSNELPNDTANAAATPLAIVLFEPDWHQGVIGIVAGRLKEQFHRPSIVFAPSDDGIHIKGSARSIEGVHIRDAIERVAEQQPELVTHFGGHAMAAGLTLPLEKLAAFTQAFQQIIAEHDPTLFQPIVITDGELAAHEFSVQTAYEIVQAGPWGQGFAYPIFEGEFDVVEYRWLKEQHLRLKLKNPHYPVLEAIAFKMADQIDLNQPIKRVKLAYQLEINDYQGRRSVQLMVQQLHILD